MTYASPLHLPVHSASRSPFSEISVAISPTRKQIPQRAWTCPGRPTRPITSQPITFDFSGCVKKGIPMQELCARSASALCAVVRGATDPVLLATGLKSLTFRIIWPGYEHLQWDPSIPLHTSSGPITRSQLAVAIAKSCYAFFQKAQNEPPRSPEWRIGPAGVQFERMILVSLWNVSDDTWQAELAFEP